ncbi:hypothetical protein [Virgibacillus doumboii]|uniref:hypothetical protein n=1 Tax=Virgibacillus doumboii TaxID=2697503 RepID=UPI0013E035B7|nr:hypothetical protein [Virgibacillus doumboii]
MAFGINRRELISWKNEVEKGNIAFLTHYWLDDRFPGCYTVTKVGCNDLEKLIEWGKGYGLKSNWIDRNESFPHYDLFGDTQKEILKYEQKWDHIAKFDL